MECFLEVQSVKILQKSPRNPKVSRIKPLFVVFPKKRIERSAGISVFSRTKQLKMYRESGTI